jgi:hypothetical protein
LCIRKAAVLALGLALAGCGASASISSARDPGAVARFSRIYVAVEPGNVDVELANGLDSALGSALQEHGVTVKTRVLSGLDLDASAIEADMKAWRPDGVLMAAFAGGSGVNGGLDTVRFDVSFIAVASNRRIWRAQVHTRKAFGTDASMMEETAETVGERLEQDGLIGSRR